MKRLLNDHYKVAMTICKMHRYKPQDPDLKRLEVMDPDPDRNPAYLAKLIGIS